MGFWHIVFGVYGGGEQSFLQPTDGWTGAGLSRVVHARESREVHATPSTRVVYARPERD